MSINLAASLIVHNEADRYLMPCIEHLLEFCDQICVVDDGSTDDTGVLLSSYKHTHVTRTPWRFFQHEGQARQFLIDWTLAHNPTHVLSLDADEFVADGAALRARLEATPDHPVWSLDIEEVWNANGELQVREDGGWRTHPLVCLWKAPPAGARWEMLNRKLACRRVPKQVLDLGGRSRPVGTSLLHFGWTDPSTRQQRYDRYTTHDGGRFHASSHLRSIMWPDLRMRLRSRPWPNGPVFERLQERFTVAA